MTETSDCCVLPYSNDFKKTTMVSFYCILNYYNCLFKEYASFPLTTLPPPPHKKKIPLTLTFELLQHILNLVIGNQATMSWEFKPFQIRSTPFVNRVGLSVTLRVRLVSYKGHFSLRDSGERKLINSGTR